MKACVMQLVSAYRPFSSSRNVANADSLSMGYGYGSKFATNRPGSMSETNLLKYRPQKAGSPASMARPESALGLLQGMDNHRFLALVSACTAFSIDRVHVFVAMFNGIINKIGKRAICRRDITAIYKKFGRRIKKKKKNDIKRIMVYNII